MDYSQALPDELWLLVLEWLPLEALLEARGVCRRWRGLTLDSSVWRHLVLDCRFLYGPMGAIKALFARRALVALRVAPRLRSLGVSDDTAPVYRKAATSTECAVAKLCLMFTRDSFYRGPKHSLEQVLRRQLQLGAGLLREVVLSVNPTRAVPMLELALRAPLTELDVILDHSEPCNSILSDAAARGNAALKVLKCSLSGPPLLMQPLLMQPLLRAHASTLQTLVVRQGWFGGDEGLLASCSQLRRLELDVRKDNAGVLAAAASAHITELILHGGMDRFDFDWEAFVPSVRSLPHLRLLELPSGRGLLSAVAGHQSSACLEELRVGSDEDLSWDGLLDTLQGLPRLRSLSVVSCERNIAQPGRVAAAHFPSLRELRLSYPCVNFRIGYCGLPLLHALVRRNPQLHVLGMNPDSTHLCYAQQRSAHGARIACDCCQRNLHLPGHSHFSLCAHGEAEQCDLPALHAHPGKCPCSQDCMQPLTWQHIS